MRIIVVIVIITLVVVVVDIVTVMAPTGKLVIIHMSVLLVIDSFIFSQLQCLRFASRFPGCLVAALSCLILLHSYRQLTFRLIDYFICFLALLMRLCMFGLLSLARLLTRALICIK